MTSSRSIVQSVLLVGLLSITIHARSITVESTFALSQTINQDLAQTSARIIDQLKTKYPNWEYERGEPMQGSTNLEIQLWSAPNGKVKVTVVPYKSHERATEALNGFMQYRKAKEKEQLKGIGDEAYLWGDDLTQIIFTKDKLVIYVSGLMMPTPEHARSLTRTEILEREKSETGRLTRDFAMNIANALVTP